MATNIPKNTLNKKGIIKTKQQNTREITPEQQLHIKNKVIEQLTTEKIELEKQLETIRQDKTNILKTNIELQTEVRILKENLQHTEDDKTKQFIQKAQIIANLEGEKSIIKKKLKDKEKEIEHKKYRIKGKSTK